MEPNEAVVEALEPVAEFIIAAKSDAGGWRFNPGSQDADVLGTSYQERAMLRAQHGRAVSGRREPRELPLLKRIECTRYGQYGGRRVPEQRRDRVLAPQH